MNRILEISTFSMEISRIKNTPGTLVNKTRALYNIKLAYLLASTGLPILVHLNL